MRAPFEFCGASVPDTNRSNPLVREDIIMETRTVFRSRTFLLLIVLIGATGLCVVPRVDAQDSGQKTFDTSKQAVDAFIEAVRADNVTDVQAILGSGSEQIISSGDSVADSAERNRFLARYDAKHALVASGTNEFTLDVGSDDWPLPIPLIHSSGRWYFDGEAGKEEIVYRRIGNNELAAIDVCKGMFAAQREYAATAHDGQPAGSYAQRIVSEPGKQNGVYWGVQAGETPSPAGPLLAQAAAEGYDTSGKQTPYHGYYYRILPSAGGYSFVAFPAEYRSSGVMTFLLNQTGNIYQKDLGDKTADAAQHPENFQLDGTWKKVK